MNILSATPRRTDAIPSALASVATRLTPVGLSSWHFTLLNGAPHVVTAQADENWLLLSADLGRGAVGPESFWSALGQNASLTGLAKVALTDTGAARLCAELPLHDDGELTTRLRETCEGFESVWAHQQADTSVAKTPSASAGTLDLKRLCVDAGWRFTERGAGKLAVELEVATGFHQALLIPDGGGVRIQSELATLDAVPDECRRAIGGFLLAASGLVRLARAAVSVGEATSVARFEIVFPTAPSPSEISSALESLSVGCSLCGEEIKTLQDPAVARRYLALRGWDGGAGGSERNTA